MTNKKVVEEFFDKFSMLDAGGMIACLADDIVYNDPIYGIIRDDIVKDLWQMRCKNLSDFTIDIVELKELDQEYITCKWQSSFFSKSASKHIKMTITSFMRLGGGKIIEHSDGYKLSDWLAKAYGFSGILLGWTGWMKKREQIKFRTMLQKFGDNKKLFSGNRKREHDYDFADR